MKKVLYFILLLFLYSCSNKQKVSISNNTFINGIGIYQYTADTININELTEKFKETFPDFVKSLTISSSYDFNYYYVNIEKPSKNFNPPDSILFASIGRGLSKEEQSGVQNYSNVISIVFGGTSENVYDKQSRIYSFIENICKNKAVIIADYNSNEWFNPQSWNEKRVVNFSDTVKNIVHQITVNISQEGELYNAVTKGMDKFCLPDISVKNVKDYNQQAAINLLNAVAQTFSENPYLNDDSTLVVNLHTIKNANIRNSLISSLKPDSKGNALIKFELVPNTYDNKINKQLQIIFDGLGYASPLAHQDSVFTSLFGAVSHITVAPVKEIIKPEYKDVLQEKIIGLKKMFQKGLEPGYTILVNAPFKVPEGGNEWMWVEVTNWREQSLNGILKNQPVKIKYLKMGSVVTVLEKDINDYVLYKPDGSFEGKIKSNNKK